MADNGEAILSVADRLEPELRARFLAAVERAKQDISIDAIVRALRDGRGLAGLVDSGPIDDELKQSVDLMTRAVQDAGTVMAAQIAQQIGATFRFDVTNPNAVDFIRRAAADMATAITRETDLAIRTIVSRAFTEQLNLDQTARLIRDLIGLNNRQAIAVLNYRSLLDKQGVPTDRVDTLVQRYTARQLNARAELIAQTQIMTASNGGQEAAWQQAQAKGLISQEAESIWIVTRDDRICPRCKSMKGQRRALGEPFVCPIDGSVVLFPPLHPRCRCTRGLVFRTAA